MKPDLVAKYPLWLCEMFYEQQARHLSKPAVSPSRWDVEAVSKLIHPQSGVSFDEAKTTLVFVWRADRTNYWAGQLSTAQDWVRAFDTLHERVCKTMPSARTTASDDSPAGRVGVDHIRAQNDKSSVEAFYDATGEERPSDDAREMYQPPQLESVPTGPDIARQTLKELGDS